MSKPIIADTSPMALKLTAGTHYWCACVRSENQPWCDGSHQGTEFQPVKLELTESSKVWLCGCKHSCDKPFCDGSHKKL